MGHVGKQFPTRRFGALEPLQLPYDALGHLLHRGAQAIDVVTVRIGRGEPHGPREVPLAKAVHGHAQRLHAPRQEKIDQQDPNQREDEGADGKIGKELNEARAFGHSFRGRDEANAEREVHKGLRAHQLGV